MLVWSRPVGVAAPFCVVVRIDASVHTACGGRWDARDPREDVAAPPETDRCGGCRRKHAGPTQ